jgi:S1-C subfamily serine protease
VRFNNAEITSFDRLKEEVDSVVPGERITVEVLRDGQKVSLKLIVGVSDEP